MGNQASDKVMLLAREPYGVELWHEHIIYLWSQIGSTTARCGEDCVDVKERKKRIKIVCCYARADESLLIDLKKHLRLWERQKIINVWSHINSMPGVNWKKELMQHMASAHIILLLVSPNFFASEHCLNAEEVAIERYKRGEARVIPIILRPCLWQDASFGELHVLPEDEKPVTMWRNRDEAFNNVAIGIRQVVDVLSYSSDQIDLPETRSILNRRTLIMGALGSVVSVSIAAAAVINNLNHPDIGTIYKTLSGHTNSIRALAWSPDGKFIATASDDQTARTWDVVAGKRIITFKGHSMPVEGVSWSPNGRLIVSGGADGTAHVWEAITGKSVSIYEGHRITYQGSAPSQNQAWVNRVQWSPNGIYIVSGDQTSDVQRIATVHVWEAKTGNTQIIYREHRNGVYSVAWSPDNTRVASVGYDGILRVWEASSGKTLLTHSGSFASQRFLFGVAWSPDGKYIAYGGTDHKVWVISANGADDASFYAFPSTEDLGVRDIAWSPSGTYIVASSQTQGIHIFNAATKEPVYKHILYPGDISALGWASKGNFIASGNGNGAGVSDFVVQVWQAPL